MPEPENTQTEVKLAPILGIPLELDTPLDVDEDEFQEEIQEAPPEGGDEETKEEGGEDSGETPPEEPEKGKTKEVSFADFLEAKGEKKDVEEKKTEEKKVEPVVLDKGKKTPRDYTGIAEEHIPLFKGMANESFAALKPVYLEHKELNAKIKQKEEELETLKKASTGQEVIHPSFHAHPKAYMLTQEYGNRLVKARLAESILDHWNTQLVKIRRGEDWKDLQEDPQTGKVYVSTEDKTATTDDELLVMRRIAEAQQASLEWKTKVNNYAEEHKSTYEKAISVVREAEKGFFPDYDKPDHPTAKIQQVVIDALPAALRDDPLAKTLAYVTANNAILQAELQKLKKTQSTGNGVKPPGTKQPLKGEFSGSVKPRTVTYQDYLNERG